MSRTYEPITCAHCGKVFTPHRHRMRFCCTPHKKAYWDARRVGHRLRVLDTAEAAQDDDLYQVVSGYQMDDLIGHAFSLAEIAVGLDEWVSEGAVVENENHTRAYQMTGGKLVCISV